MPEPTLFDPQLQRNYLDDILDQARQDIKLERQRQESIINAPDPGKRLGEVQRVEKQVTDEPEDVQRAVLKKTYNDTSYWGGVGDLTSKIKKERDEEPYDELVARFHEYNEKLTPYIKQEYDRISQEKLGTIKSRAKRERMQGEYFDYPEVFYTEEDIKNEALSSAKARLSEEGLIKPKATGITALKETFTDWKRFGKKLPWIGGGAEALEAFGIINAIRDVKAGTADEDDYRVLIETQMEMERDSDWTNMATEIFLTLPGYAIEFASTGSMATGARVVTKEGVRKLLNWALTKQGKKLIKEGSESFALRATQGVLGTTVGAVARTINPKTWNRTLGNATQQMIPDYELDQAQNGKIEVIADEFKDWGTALTEGALLTFTENLGEEFGEVFAFGGKEFRAYMKTNPESAVSGLIKSIIRKNPNVPVGKVMQSVRQAGIHSVPVEILEERVTDFLQSGIEGHEFHWPTPEEWLAEIVAIGGFAGGARGIGKIADSRTRKRKESAKQKGLKALETGQLRQLTDEEISYFAGSLSEEEAMEVGLNKDTRQFEAQSEMGKELTRRDLGLDQVPETMREAREMLSKKNIAQQKEEGKDFVGSLINKINEMTGGAVEVEREYLDRRLADEIEEEGLSDDRVKEILREHGIDENTDPKKIMITGRTSGFVVRLSTAGTEARLADEFVAVSEEMAEVSYNAESQNRDDFNEDTQESKSWENEITEDRRKYHEATGEQDTGESNKEWFSTMAIRFATQGKVHQSIGAKLTEIFNRFIDNARTILKDAFQLRKAIKAGKVSDSLLKKLEEATDFKKIGEKVQQAKESKKDTSYRAVKAPLSLSNQKYGQLKKLMYQLTEEGEPAKYWYEQSGQALLDITNGDKDLAKKLLSIIAITSPRMDVKTNFGQMIKGYYKVLLGEKPLAGMFPTSMSKKIQEVMDGKEWKGLKTDKFLKNLVAVIDGGSPDVTVDMWMMRAFGIDKDAPTDLEYRTVERLVQDIADDIGWEPFQVQASIWTATKARWEKVYKPLFAKAKKAGLYKDGKWKNKLAEKNFRKRVYREFKKVTITQEEIEKAGFNYKDAIDIYKGRISHEVVPHPTTKVLPKIHKAPYEQQLEYHYAVNGVLSDENGRDIIAGFLGIPEVTSFDSPGFYEESSSPSKHTEVLFSSSVSAYLKPGKLNKVINPETLENIELYSAIRALVTRQKAIGFTKEFESPSKKLANAVTVEVDKGLTTEQLQAVYNGMIDAGIDTGPMPTDYGFILVNFMDNDGNPYSGVSNVSFENIVDNVIEKVFKNENIELTLRSATSLGSLVENDWSKNKHGENYQKRISESGRSSSIRKLVSTLNGEIQQVNEEYSKKYNWGNPGKLEESKETGQRSYHLAPTFYSKAERVVTEQFPPTMKSQSVENFLLKNQVKPEEIQWLDLETLTRNKPKITKEELQDWIQANKIDVQDVFKGPILDDNDTEVVWIETGFEEWEDSDYNWRITKDPIDGQYGLYNLYGGLDDSFETLDEAQFEVENKIELIGNVRHSQYQLPGEKEDYRELLLTLPMAVDFANITFNNKTNEYEVYGSVNNLLGSFGNKEDAESLMNYLKHLKFKKDTFTTGHFDEPNILAHVRFNTRKSPTGEQVLFIEELQSDWHTQGRKHGYRPKKEIKELPPEYTIETKESDGGGWWARVPEISTQWLGQSREKDVAIAQAKGNALISLNKGDVGVPDAPFKNNGWIELIMKRMLRYASENNFDRIAWTTSNQQIDRWSDQIRQNVDQIHWQKIEPSPDSVDSNKLLEDLGRGIPKHDSYTLKGSHVIINGLKKKENVFNNTIPLEGETTINGQKVTLEGLLGKQMATQIRNSDKPTGIIEGDNLTIGGQGFKTVYDFAIKKILNKMGKKFGAKVDQVELDMTISGVGGTGRDAEDFGMVGVEIQTTQPSIPVTRKMKESALKGQPTFRASKMTSTDDVLDSPSFKKWFKGSKVVDENGKPLVMYHGTTKDFDEFNTKFGSYFSSYPGTAEGYAGKPFEEKVVGNYPIGSRIIPVYLSVKNPKILINPIDDETFEESYSSFPYRQLKAEGHDSVIIKWNDGEVEAYVLEPAQIKSVFNKGTFNPHDPRISFHMAPTNLVTPLATIYQEQKGTKKKYTKKDFELDLVRLGYPDDTIKTAMDLYGIIRTKQIDIDDGEPTAIEKEIAKEKERDVKRGNIKSRLDALKRGHRVGTSEAKKEIEKLQKIITNYARENLPIGEYKKSEITGIIAKVRDAKRQKDLAVAMEKIDRIIDKVSKRTALSKWNKSIKKKATLKKVSGIVRGKVGANIQDIVNDIRRYHKLSPAEIDDKLDDLGKVMTVNEPTEENLLKQKWLLTFGAIKHKTPEEITKATEVFDLLVTKGRVMVMEEQQAYKERMLEVVSEILDIITGGAGPQSQGGAQNLGLNKRTVMADIKEKLSSLDSQQQSLEYIFDKLSRLDKTSKPLESFINNYFMPQIRQARLSEYNGIKEMQTLMIKKLEEIYGLKGWKLRSKMNENSVNTISIDHHDGMENDMKGPLITSELTYNEAYKKWMELRDPTLHPTFEKMGWDIEKAKRQIEDQLPKEIMEWANWQLYEFYPMYYHRVNETFRRRFYVNMPFNPAYSPISRMVGGQVDEGDVTLQNAKSTFSSVHSAGSLKGRVSNTEELVWIDGDAILNKHIAEMEHFIAYTDVIREMRSVFMNRSVSNSIKNFHGTGIRRVLNKMMDDLARGGVDKSNNIESLDKWRIAFTKAVIGINPVVYLKQLASIPAYMSDIPMLDWSKEFAKLMNPIEFKRMYRTLSKSKMIDMRYDKGFERDMVSTLNSVRKQRFTDSDSFTQLLFLFTKMGDKQAIFLGGWPVYKYHYKNAIKAGKSKEEAGSIAMKKFESSSQRSQQSGEVEDLSQWQRSGSIGKLFTMFMTSPNQYYRMVAGAVRNFHYGRGTKTENIRKIFVGAILLPQLFTFIANGFEWDDEDFWITLASWPLAGLMFWGKPIAWGIEYAKKGIAWGKPGEIPVFDVFNDFAKAGKILVKDKDKLDMEAFFKAMLEMVEGITKFRTGIPVGPIRRTVSGAVKVAKGEAQHPIREAIGFKFKGKKKKKKRKYRN